MLCCKLIRVFFVILKTGVKYDPVKMMNAIKDLHYRSSLKHLTHIEIVYRSSSSIKGKDYVSAEPTLDRLASTITVNLSVKSKYFTLLMI